jgi:4-hydroxybenzoate polyprenyltransferase
MAPNIPLIVDLDGTLTPTDTLVESVLRLVRQQPMIVWQLLTWLVRGRAVLKEEVARRMPLDASTLPYRPEMLRLIEAAGKSGCTVVLATAADIRYADAVQNHLKCFDHVLASDGAVNLKAEAKLGRIRERFGDQFVYAGDSTADIPIWKHASGAVVVDDTGSLARRVGAVTKVTQVVRSDRSSTAELLRAMRPHQWAKNLLLFVPLFTGFHFHPVSNVMMLILGFIAFSLLASATYLLNDLLDIDSDRRHPRKRNRPFAAASVSIGWGASAIMALLLGGVALAAAASPAFLGVLLTYLALTVAYSLVIKQYVLLDAFSLASLYTLRIFAGAVLIQVEVSSWLFAFSMFVFLSLALVKRCSELQTLSALGSGASHGRDYRVSDMPVLWSLGVGSGIASIVVFGLYSSSPETLARYSSPQWLWLSSIGLLYWVSRLWIKTVRGEMHDDPVVYAFRDRGSRLTVVGIGLTVLAAHLL